MLFPASLVTGMTLKPLCEKACEKSIRSLFLTSLRYPYLWLSKASSTCFAHADFDSVKVFQYLWHRHILQFWNIFPAPKKVAAQSKLFIFCPGAQDSVMPDPYKMFWWYMHQKSPNEFYTGKCAFLPFTFIAVIFHWKGDIFFIHTDDPVVAYGNPVCIFTKIINDRLSTIKGLFAVWYPFSRITAVNQFLESIMVSVLFCRTVEFKFFCLPKLF